MVFADTSSEKLPVEGVSFPAVLDCAALDFSAFRAFNCAICAVIFEICISSSAVFSAFVLASSVVFLVSAVTCFSRLASCFSRLARVVDVLPAELAVEYVDEPDEIAEIDIECVC